MHEQGDVTLQTLLLHTENPADIEQAGAILRGGGLVAIPTETVYGLAADALNPEAAKAIFAAKGRPADNPLIVHICDLNQWPELVREIPESAWRLAKAYWPGPLTIILPRADCIPDAVSAGLPTVAVRFPSHPAAQAVIRASGCPLAAPSANLSGKPSPTTAAHVMEDMDGRIDAVLDGGPCDVGVESTVITLATQPPRLLRPGGITLEQLQAVLGEVEVDPAVTHQLAAGVRAASPGMKYKHYAPKAQVTMLSGISEQFVSFVNQWAGRPVRAAALCYEEEKDRIRIPAISCGKSDDLAAQAQHLFDALRRVDDDLHASCAFAHCPPQEGVGLAVYNRLVRAAAFHQIDLTPRVIGLTGPTGGGKSAVSDHLRALGCVIVDCDQIAREAVRDSDVLKNLCAAFGADILDEDGALIRRRLAERAFASQETTQKLDDITHPWIMARVGEQIRAAQKLPVPAVVVDAPQLFEAHGESLCDCVLVVTAPQEERLRRICARDGLTREEALRRMSIQLSEEEFLRRADCVIHNLNLQDTLAQAEAFLRSMNPYGGTADEASH